MMKTAGFPTNINDRPAMMCSTAGDLTSLDNWNPITNTYSINNIKLTGMSAKAICSGAVKKLVVSVLGVISAVYSASF